MRTSLLWAAAVVLLAGCTPSSEKPEAAAAVGCGSAVEKGPLPEWALSGFSGDSSMPHVFGTHGDIVGALFAYPLIANRSDDMANKILWVSRIPTGPGDLVIAAKLDGSAVSASRSVTGGPGPSIIDLPQAGCWHLTLTWSGHTDTMDLTYQ